MFFCPVCEVENRLDAKFCRKCGQSRATLEQYVVTSITDQPPEQPRAQAPISTVSPPEESPINSPAVPPIPPKTTGNGSSVEDETASQQLLTGALSPECPACLTALRATDQYCCWCGEPQPSRALPYMKMCLECGTKLPEKAHFCYSCGSNVTDKSVAKVRFPVELFHEEESEFFPRFDA